MEITTLKMNDGAELVIPEIDGYIRFPYEIAREKLSVSERLVRSLIYSFSCVKDKPEARCNMSFSTFENRLRYSRTTINKAIHAAMKKGRIAQDKSNRFRASYKYCFRDDEREQTLPAFTLYFFLLHTAFKRKDGKSVYLTKSAALVLSLIKSHDDYHGFEGSVSGIAMTLGFSRTTVQKAISLLMEVKLISRRAEDRGVNGSKRSRYIVNGKLLRRAEKAFRNGFTKTAAVESRSDPTEEIADRERYYARLQQIEETRIENLTERLNRDSCYTLLQSKIKSLEIEAARAELFAPLKLAGIQNELKDLQFSRAKRMAEIGISESDLAPVYQCPRCQDTGYNKSDGHICDCYPFKRRRRT